MGVQADSATSVMNMFPDLGGANGFTEGDLQIGDDATQLTNTFFNNVVEEINGAIAGVGNIEPAFDDGARRQLRDAILLRMYDQLGSDFIGDTGWTRRTFLAPETSAEHEWRKRIRNGYVKNAPESSAQDVVFLSFPINSQALIQVDEIVVRVAAVASYSARRTLNTVRRNSVGAYIFQNQQVLYANGDVPVTGGPVAGPGPAFAYRLNLPDEPSDAHFNVHVEASLLNVTTSIV